MPLARFEKEIEKVVEEHQVLGCKNTAVPFLAAASVGAPLFALWVIFDYRRVTRGTRG